MILLWLFLFVLGYAVIITPTPMLKYAYLKTTAMRHTSTETKIKAIDDDDSSSDDDEEKDRIAQAQHKMMLEQMRRITGPNVSLPFPIPSPPTIRWTGREPTINEPPFHLSYWLLHDISRQNEKGLSFHTIAETFFAFKELQESGTISGAIIREHAVEIMVWDAMCENPELQWTWDNEGWEDVAELSAQMVEKVATIVKAAESDAYAMFKDDYFATSTSEATAIGEATSTSEATAIGEATQQSESGNN